jgi:hypothetical protein
MLVDPTSKPSDRIATNLVIALISAIHFSDDVGVEFPEKGGNVTGKIENARL